MALTTFDFRERRRRATPFSSLISVRNLASVTLVAYLCQVTLFGPIRYFLSLSRLEVLWYIPDLLGILCIIALLLRSPTRNVGVLMFLVAIGLYLLEGYVVSGSANSVLSTFKSLVPLFCGLLLDRDILGRRGVRAILLVLLVAAVGGVIYSSTGPMPWSNLRFEGVGVTQQFKSAQWAIGGDVRNFGFGGDQHSAASSILTLFVLLAVSARRKTILYCCAALAIVGVYLTTSRTNLLALLVFMALFAVSDVNRSALEQPLLRFCLRLSLLSFIVPIAIIGIALSFTSESVPGPLLSLWIRGTNTWLAPFRLIDYLAPFALIHGFGLGGVGPGLLQSDLAEYFTTVDNFILLNYLTFGVPYLFFYIYQGYSIMRERDAHRVMVFIATMIYGLTLRGWSDYLFMILVGYSIASIFRTRAPVRRGLSEGRPLSI